MPLLHSLFRRSHFIVAVFVLLALVHSAFAIDVAPQFSDVPSTAWFAQDINSAQTIGIVSGYKDAYGRQTGKFGPENAVTVGEALKMALTSAGYDISRGQGYGHWAAGYLSIAISNHFLFTQNGYINLDRPALRSEVASLLADAFRVPSGSEPYALNDIAGNAYAEQIAGLARDNIVSGDTDATGISTGHFRPDERINRAEAVRMTMRSRAKYPGVGGGYVLSSSASSWSSLKSSSISSTSSLRTTGACSEKDCGYAPYWNCPDRSVPLPKCERFPDQRCGWHLYPCVATSSSLPKSSACSKEECGIGPLIPNWQCPDGSIAGPQCLRQQDSRCGWLVRQCGMSSSASKSSSRSSSRSFCSPQDCGPVPADYPLQCLGGAYGGLSCVLFSGRCVWESKLCPLRSSMSSSSSSSKVIPATSHTVLYTSAGFQPSLITIRKGDKIDFRNDVDIAMWVASNPHPTHGDYSSFDSKSSKAKNSIYTFTFSTVGVFGYHNHLKPEHLGVVVVAE